MSELKISYEKGWNSTFIHVDTDGPYEENYQMRMLRNNSLPHLADMSGSGRDGMSRYSFRSDGGILLEEKYRSIDLHAQDVLIFTEQLLEAVESLTEYMLNPDRLLLAPELIFAEDNGFRFCYLPVQERENDVTLGEAFHGITEYFVSRLDYRENEGILLVYRLHKETMQKSYDLKKILDDYKQELTECTEDHGRKEEKREENSRDSEESEEYLFNKDRQSNHALSDGTIFLADEEEDEHIYMPRKKGMYLKEKAVSYGPVRKVINRIKTGRWGEWEDLITEIDGQDR